MEIPYNGRATFDEQFGHTTISTPAKKNAFIVMFLGVWLCGWTFGETSAITALLHEGNGPDDLFMIFWLCGWTIGGAFALRTFLWLLAGKEIIKIGQGQLSVSRKYALFVKPKTYDLREAKNFRVQEEPSFASTFGNRNKSNPFNIADEGTIRFDYGMKTIKFGTGLDEAEATHILQRLKDKKLLSDKNFGATVY